MYERSHIEKERGMSEMVKRYIKAARKWIIDAVRGLYPFLICWLGAGLLLIGSDEESAIVRAFVAGLSGLSWIWALDLASARAEAKAKSETAAIFLASLTSGSDTEINVNFYHHEKD